MSTDTVAAEEWPDGTYGGARSLRTSGQPDPAAAARQQALDEVLSGWTCGTTTELRDRAATTLPPSQLITEKGNL
ncbi:hypothetical protein ACIRFF_08740 [Streptomyces cyaneofuscatus]